MTLLSANLLRNRARQLITNANGMLGVARDLERMAAELEHGPSNSLSTSTTLAKSGSMPSRPGGASTDDHPYFIDLARRAYGDRRRRDRLFQSGLFGEPAWDILLDLFISAKQCKRVSVTSACIGAAVPSTTALRWLAVLEQQGHIVREDDPADARRAFLQLSAETYAMMLDYFAPDAANCGEQFAMAANG
ncbi:MarR family transcriptional regulator [Novosphingobium sp.]|uniref:MarR family transcriptional regulator n=1 Tax=Novosphingobium sp. TaxID=1874826 RepID=UPI003341B30A